MKGLLQRVSSASVFVDQKNISKIKAGILLFLGVEQNDIDDDIFYMVKKVSALRIFEDKNNKINLSIKDVGGSVLVISQFTLCANIKRGRRPSFVGAAETQKAKSYYDLFCLNLKKEDINVQTGIFGANMQIKLQNDGPFTIMIDSHNR